MDAEDELHNLTDPGSLSEIMKPSPEVINLMSTSSDSHPPEATPDIFPIRGLGGVPPTSRAPFNSRFSSISRPEISFGFHSDTVLTSAQPAWPPPPELVKQYDDAVKNSRFIPTFTPKATFAFGDGWRR